MTTILVLGGNFGGMTSAFELQRKLRMQARVVVVSRQKEFVYIPSLIWVPFGRRSLKDITFSAEATFRKAGIEFVLDEATRINPEASTVRLASGRELSYDFLIIATGAELVWDSLPGLGPRAFTHSIFTPPDAEATYASFQKFLEAPGPAVIGAVPGASCMGAGYEYLFNFDRYVRKHRVRNQVPITWVTPEPRLGHFGIGGIRGGELMRRASFLPMTPTDTGHFRISSQRVSRCGSRIRSPGRYPSACRRQAFRRTKWRKPPWRTSDVSWRANRVSRANSSAAFRGCA